MINIEFTDGGWGERLAAMGRTIPQALADMGGALAGSLSDSIRRGLGAGALAQSLEVEVVPEATGVAASVASGLPYSAYQEYGFSGVELVAAHLRRVSVVYGRRLANPVEAWVSASMRRVDYAGKGFMSRPFADMEGAIASGFEEAVVREVAL